MFSRDYKRVIYGKNPIVQVSCIIRFPAILLIDTAVPGEFQESLRAMLPVYKPETFKGDERDFVTAEPAIPPGQLRVRHSFASESGELTVQLTSNRLVLSTENYETWPKFKEFWKQILARFVEFYKPIHFEYVALNYDDLIIRTELGLSNDTPWNELIKPYVLGEVGEPSIKDVQFVMSNKKYIVALPESIGYLGVQHGLADIEETDEVAYLIESIFFGPKKTEVRDAEATLDKFNGYAGSFFRWCITDKLHQAMDPKAP